MDNSQTSSLKTGKNGENWRVVAEALSSDYELLSTLNAGIYG